MFDSAEFDDWYQDVRYHLDRAADDTLEMVRRFVEDWAPEYGIRCERDPQRRVKTPDRVAAKCIDKAINTGFDCLLHDPYPVGDLVGVRFVVRSRADVEAVVAALNNQTSLPFREVEDLVLKPRGSGYRALHINGHLPVTVRDDTRTVPFEVQVQTLAQDAWGYFTHDTAYVPDETNQHPRFAHVRELQRLLADLLNDVDALQQQVEVQASQIAYEVAENADPEEIMFASVQAALREMYGTSVSVSEASRLADLARRLNLGSMGDFRAIVDPESPEAADFAGSFAAVHGRQPDSLEVATELLHRSVAE